ncbi:hypothetical protein NC651_012752 [Populus alba x Populus x berolinensis]|nr:hypothetical protein NC651_012752 [Populus alba x Populus x berolinensis]
MHKQVMAILAWLEISALQPPLPLLIILYIQATRSTAKTQFLSDNGMLQKGLLRHDYTIIMTVTCNIKFKVSARSCPTKKVELLCRMESLHL